MLLFLGGKDDILSVGRLKPSSTYRKQIKAITINHLQEVWFYV